jgi:hypothetical protein
MSETQLRDMIDWPPGMTDRSLPAGLGGACGDYRRGAALVFGIGACALLVPVRPSSL